MLLRPMEGEDLEELFRETPTIMPQFFYKINKWSPMDLPT